MGFIGKEELSAIAGKLKNNGYGQYLARLLK
jgi:hypothetical protein